MPRNLDLSGDYRDIYKISRDLGPSWRSPRYLLNIKRSWPFLEITKIFIKYQEALTFLEITEIFIKKISRNLGPFWRLPRHL
jgi:hypothetical protein